MFVTRLFAGALLLLTAVSPLGAQSPERNPLAKVKHLKCVVSVTAAGGWKGGVAQAQVTPEELSFEISAIDLDDGTAEVLSAGGPVHITALLTGSSVHFLERSFQGNLTVTSVFPPADAKGRYRAVRSRHDYLVMNIPGFIAEPTVQQRYGACETFP